LYDYIAGGLFNSALIVSGLGGVCYLIDSFNTSMESWNHSLKVEAIHGVIFLTRAEAMNNQ